MGVLSVAIDYGTADQPLPANDEKKGTYYVQIGTYNHDDAQKLIVSNDRRGPIDLLICDVPYSNPTRHRVALVQSPNV